MAPELPHGPMKVLFLDQGRTTSGTAMGHVRVQHALAAALPGLATDLRTVRSEVPAFTLAQRLFARPVRSLHGWDLWAVRWHLARSWAARQLVKRSIVTTRPDVAHITTDQVALLLSDVQDNLPCVPSLDILTLDWVRLVQRIPPEAALPAFLRPLAYLERRALERAPLCIAWTATIADSIARLAPKAKTEILHPGLDLETLRPIRKPAVGRPMRVLFVGGRWQAKGGPALVRALRPELGSRVTLDVVTTESIDVADGMYVHAAKPGSADLADLFARADIFCLPTSADAVPWVVLEAMASGVPVVSTRIGSIPEMLGGQAGLAVEPGDIDGLRRALHTLLEDAELRTSMGEAGRARAEELYDARKNTPELIDRLASVAK